MALTLGLVVGQQPAVLKHVGNGLAKRLGGQRFAHHVQQGHKGAQIGAGFAGHGVGGVVQRAAVGFGRVLQLLEAACANATRRKVNYPAPAGVVVRVFKQAQIRQGVLDFGPLKKAQPAVHPVGHAGVEQGGFNDSALGVAAVQHGHGVAPQPLAAQRAQLFHHPLRLKQVGARLHHPHGFARTGLGAQIFA